MRALNRVDNHTAPVVKGVKGRLASQRHEHFRSPLRDIFPLSVIRTLLWGNWVESASLTCRPELMPWRRLDFTGTAMSSSRWWGLIPHFLVPGSSLVETPKKR